MTLAGTLWGGSPRRTGYPIGIATWEGRCVLIDPERGRVARHLPEEHSTDEQLTLRDRWASHIATPTYRLERGGTWITEEHVVGDHLSHLPGDDQVKLVRSMLRSYADLVVEEAHPPQPGVAQHLSCPDVLMALPLELRRRLHELPLLQDVDRWPWVPTTSDHSLKNVVAASDRLVFIDVMPIVQRPFFDLPVALLTLWGASLPGLRRAHLGGDLDAEFRDIFSAAGFDYESTPATRQSLVALSTSLRALSTSRRGADIDTDTLRHQASDLLRSQALLTPDDWQF